MTMHSKCEGNRFLGFVVGSFACIIFRILLALLEWEVLMSSRVVVETILLDFSECD